MAFPFFLQWERNEGGLSRLGGVGRQERNLSRTPTSFPALLRWTGIRLGKSGDLHGGIGALIYIGPQVGSEAEQAALLEKHQVLTSQCCRPLL